MGSTGIDKDRLWQRIADMAKIGATPKGGVRRLALTKEDKASRELFIDWCKALGCTIRIDAMGNIFARRAGIRNDLPAVLIGSHLDSQPTGGKYDGAYGVLAGLEVFETLNDLNLTTTFPLELVSWTNEEGARFAPAMLASGVFAGVFSLEYAYTRVDKNGITLGHALEDIGYKGPITTEEPQYYAALELHIEQGPILENIGKSVGIVTGVQGIRWYDLTITGEETHAGPCPMELRKDPVQKALQVLQQIYTSIREHGPEARVTVGTINTVPGVRNTVPNKVTATVDIRHPDGETLDNMHQILHALVNDNNDTDGVHVQLDEIWHAPPVRFNEKCIEAVRDATQTLNIPALEMVSGAGHDAVYLSRVMPTSMIFIPCKDGISHNENESIRIQDAADGTNVLLHAILHLNTTFNS